MKFFVLLWNELKEDWFILTHNAVLILFFVLVCLFGYVVGHRVGVVRSLDKIERLEEEVDTYYKEALNQYRKTHDKFSN